MLNQDSLKKRKEMEKEML